MVNDRPHYAVPYCLQQAVAPLQSTVTLKPRLERLSKMSNNHASLDAASTDRKARLAKLASLKRKQPPQADESVAVSQDTETPLTEERDISHHLSGRNYDFSSRGPRLGFENAPIDGKETLELRAETIADVAREAEAKGRKEDKPLDLFTLQPKKPNWDLKRDLAKKLEVLDQRTDNAIARIVRERIQSQNRKENEDANGDEVRNVDGVDLLEGVKVRELEEAAEIQRELHGAEPEV